MSDADLDLLSDYVGGALDGTPDEATVASLVATDPDWAAAYAALTGAHDAVLADLGALAAVAEPMPHDVAERLDGALAAAAADGGVTSSDEPGRSRGGLTVVPIESARGARKRRRWPAWATPVGVAAGLLACAGLSLTWINGRSATEETSAGSAADSGVAAPAPQAGGGATSVPSFAAGTSGQNYTRQTLGAIVVKGKFLSFSGAERSSADAAQGTEAPGTLAEPDSALSRLQDPAAFQACIDAIGFAHGSVPVTVVGADYARFEGRPALVVVFTDPGGQRWAWASGPECGVAGADELFSTRVG